MKLELRFLSRTNRGTWERCLARRFVGFVRHSEYGTPYIWRCWKGLSPRSGKPVAVLLRITAAGFVRSTMFVGSSTGSLTFIPAANVPEEDRR